MSPVTGFFRKGSDPDDVEMLQTDVMRFFAIICLCLMAVFVLIKAMPMVSPQPLKTVRDDLALKDLEARNTSLVNEVTQLEQQIKVKDHQIDQLAQKEAEKNQALAKMSGALGQAREKEKSLNKALAQHKRNVIKARPQKEKPRKRLETKSKSPKKMKSEAKTEIPTTLPVPKTDPAEPKNPGFTLRFASPDALDRLAKSGQVQVVVLASDTWLKLSFAGRGVRFSSHKAPQRFYEMEGSTVPQSFLKALGRVNKPVWGVVLPGTMEMDVARFIKRYKGGEIIIQADGDVSIQPFES